MQPVVIEFAGGIDVEAALAQIREMLTTEAVAEGTLLVRILPPPDRGSAPVPSRRAVAATSGGPGTELKKLLGRFGIHAEPGCACMARASLMDTNESRQPGWCEAHVDSIVGWLREEATKRGLPFLDAAGRVLVRRAISNARKEQARGTTRSPLPPQR